MEIGHYTGGDLATHAYWLEAGEDHDGVILFDAPQGIVAALKKRDAGKVAALVLTHGHFDHMWEAAAVVREHQCPVYIHPADAFMIEDPGLFKMWIGIELEPVTEHQPLDLPDEGAGPVTITGRTFPAYHIPGHSPGSVAFYDEANARIIAGDTLFAGGLGRWDLPGGSFDQLASGIRTHLLPLPPETAVLPGHGPATTIGTEAATNPYLAK